MRQLKQYTITLVLIAFLTSPLLAHPHHPLPQNVAVMTGLSAGFAHPWTGLDHLLAMVAVGVLSIRLGGRCVWAGPLAFLTGIIGGGLLGMSASSFPVIPVLIPFTVMMLGLSLIFRKSPPVTLLLATFLLFGAVHGYAHGIETPRITQPGAYMLGFLLSSAILHFAGIVSGLAMKNRQTWFGTNAFQLSGAAITLAGLLFAVGL